ncbi:MAG: hypothetical protein ACYTGH_05645 [Planctomycetota bacterium]|jgi:hypothetical protein
MNCTYRDGSAKPLQGVAEYADMLSGLTNYTWQYSATDYGTNKWYWWPWAADQR